MKSVFTICFLFSTSVMASVVGISTHPLSNQARVLSAEMTGHMSGGHEMGMGVRYTQEAGEGRLLDVMASGGQDERALLLGGGLDFEILSEEVSQPRVSLKPFFQFQKLKDQSFNTIGAAPLLRKGFRAAEVEVFPYLAFPIGLQIDNRTNRFDYLASLSFGASLPLPAADNKLILSLEGNKNMGSSSDYVGFLVSWVWK